MTGDRCRHDTDDAGCGLVADHSNARAVLAKLHVLRYQLFRLFRELVCFEWQVTRYGWIARKAFENFFRVAHFDIAKFVAFECENYSHGYALLKTFVST